MNATLTIFKCRFYPVQFLVLLFCFLLMEGTFSWLFVRNSIIIEGYMKLMGLFIYAFMLYKYNQLKKEERIYVFLFTLVMLRLVFESLFKYNSFFRQLTMFTVLFPVIYVVFTKYIFRWLQADVLPFVAKFYLVTYVVFMVLFGRGFSFSLESVEMTDYGPFSGDSRIIHASHILMMIVPLLWYLHQFFTTNKTKYLLPLLLCVTIIVIHQHRSVWSSALVAIFFYSISMLRNGWLRTGKIANLLLAAAGVMALCYFFASNLMPGFVDFLSDRFSEIFNPSKEGSTGNFRLEQREVYFELFLQRPVFGWTFEGFEMPNPLVDWWPDMTGQHFHEGYMEMLFYHGIAGLLLKYSFLVYLLFKAFSRNLSPSSIILIAFCISGLVFSLNYVLPLIFWGQVGLCLYYLELDKQRTTSKLKQPSDELYMHMDMRG